MSSLSGRRPRDTFSWLLHLGGGGPLDATPRLMFQGDGTELPLAVTTTALYVGGFRVLTTDDDLSGLVIEEAIVRAAADVAFAAVIANEVATRAAAIAAIDAVLATAVTLVGMQTLSGKTIAGGLEFQGVTSGDGRVTYEDGYFQLAAVTEPGGSPTGKRWIFDSTGDFAAGFGTETLTASRSWTFPDTSGIVMLQGGAISGTTVTANSFVGVTKAMVGLGSVDNTSDAAKPVSAAQETRIETKGGKITVTTYGVGSDSIALPTGAKLVSVVMGGGGGGGGSGRRGASETTRTAGGGGAGGSILRVLQIPVGRFSWPISRIVGVGGSGGIGVSLNDTNGNNGAPGGDTAFAGIVCRGGAGGGGGSTTTALGGVAIGSSAGVLGVTLVSQNSGANSAPLGGAGNSGQGSISAVVGGSGGSGGGFSATNSNAMGGKGGDMGWIPGVVIFGGQAVASSDGQPGASFLVGGGSGGGGGSTAVGGIGRRGGNGGSVGGGGGGSASANENISGAGGSGGDGFLEVTFYF